MIENSASQVPAAAEDGEAASDDPGPSPLALIVLDDGWRAMGDVEATVAMAAMAATAKVPALIGREASVVLSSDDAVRELNAAYRGQDKPTNVLSFPAPVIPGLPPGEAPLGDIIVARETVLREAAEEARRPLDHLAHLTVHGLLHLAGFDHESDAEAATMEALESDILASLGIPDPYSTPFSERPSSGRGPSS